MDKASGGTTTPAAKAMSKTEMLSQLADKSGVDKKSCGAVMTALEEVIGGQLGKKGPGVFALSGLIKIQKIKKPARKAGTRENPFKPGEMMQVAAKPASTSVKVRPLKKLKDMVA